MLLMIRSSAVCLLHTISTALNSSTSSPGDGLLASADAPDAQQPGSSRKAHKVGGVGLTNGLSLLVPPWCAEQSNTHVGCPAMAAMSALRQACDSICPRCALHPHCAGATVAHC
jgi:hypothetical protein